MIEHFKRYEGNPIKCKNCQSIIGFHKTKSGYYIPVDLFPIDRREGLFYYSNMGNHHNLTVRHDCKKVLEEREETNKRLREIEEKRLEREKDLALLEKSLIEEKAKESPNSELINSIESVIKILKPRL
jgi:hypothetical protein